MVQMGPKGSQMLGLWSIIQTTHKDKLKQFGVAQSLKVETLVLVSHWRRRSARTSSICHFRQTEQYKYVWMCVRSSSCVRASETNGKWIQQRPCDMAAAEKQMHSMEWQSAKAKANKQINNWAQYMPDLVGEIWEQSNWPQIQIHTSVPPPSHLRQPSQSPLSAIQRGWWWQTYKDIRVASFIHNILLEFFQSTLLASIGIKRGRTGILGILQS